MSNNPACGQQQPTARDILADLSLSRPASALLTGDPGPEEFQHLLAEHGHHTDAIRFTTRCLEPRQVVWWACLCVRHTEPEQRPAEDAAALAAAVRWVLRPEPATQQDARNAAAATERHSAAGLIARAASRGAGLPARAFAKLAAAAILVAAGRRPAQARGQTYREFLALADDVAAGRLPWEKPASPPPGQQQPAPGSAWW